ncbi:hypothetical protein [Nocardia bovistercoris]|uniref:Helix-turn-helix domain-containing protein n=1 Tax=Nocardia bovistercoris TaxID=2785916 RepID=A0A931N307_9NOCA|nr:hypothetical protein [Nocardia bovistercoris]MBH0780095.1 hypothetical protein [Nocardia bovistercoris]
MTDAPIDDTGPTWPGARGDRGRRNWRTVPDRYIHASNRLREDTRLSHNAKGIWFAIATGTDDTPVTINNLADHSADGRHAVSSGVNELLRYGYLTRSTTRTRNTRGHLGTYEYSIIETP